MSNLIVIQNQIQKLQKQESLIKAKEFHATVLDIRAKMQAFGITVKDLLPAKGRGGKIGAETSKTPLSANARKKSASAVLPKYRGPNNEVWSGRGLTPRWMATLLANGQNKEDFAIKG